MPRHAFVVMIQKRLDEVDRQTCRLRDSRSRSAEIVGGEGGKAVVGDDAADGLAQRMTGKRRHGFELAAKHGLVVRAGRFVLAGVERFADQSHSGRR